MTSKKSIFKYVIENCEFTFKCPTNWSSLEKTNEEIVRFCNGCKKSVKLCLDQNEIDAAASAGSCIAHPIYTPELMAKIEAYESGIGDWPFENVEMSLGLPSGNKK